MGLVGFAAIQMEVKRTIDQEQSAHPLMCSVMEIRKLGSSLSPHLKVQLKWERKPRPRENNQLMMSMTLYLKMRVNMMFLRKLKRNKSFKMKQSIFHLTKTKINHLLKAKIITHKTKIKYPN